MAPPLFYSEKKITSKGDIIVVPIIINGVQADLLVSVNNMVGIN